MLPPQKSMNNSLNHFDYSLYHDYNNKFDPYLEYGVGDKNKIAIENIFYR